MDSMDGSSLSACISRAEQMGYNAFNYKPGYCYFKKCYNGDLKIAEKQDHGGYTIYTNIYAC